MKYRIEEIKYNDISPTEFENLTYDLLTSYNFQNIVWRKGGADSGRDIEAQLYFSNAIKKVKTKWFFECKHYLKGVPPEDLNSKIAWADAENPDFLVFIISSYLTNNARTWLEKIKVQKIYNIIVIEGDELKERIIQYPDLVERYFALNRHEKLLKNAKENKNKFNICPSFELMNLPAASCEVSCLLKQSQLV